MLQHSLYKKNIVKRFLACTCHLWDLQLSYDIWGVSLRFCIFKLNIWHVHLFVYKTLISKYIYFISSIYCLNLYKFFSPLFNASRVRTILITFLILILLWISHLACFKTSCNRSNRWLKKKGKMKIHWLRSKTAKT